jgi:hypothetical protein
MDNVITNKYPSKFPLFNELVKEPFEALAVRMFR